MPDLSHVEDEKLDALLNALRKAEEDIQALVRELIALGIIPGEVMDRLLRANSDRATLKERIANFSPVIH